MHGIIIELIHVRLNEITCKLLEFCLNGHILIFDHEGSLLLRLGTSYFFLFVFVNYAKIGL